MENYDVKSTISTSTSENNNGICNLQKISWSETYYLDDKRDFLSNVIATYKCLDGSEKVVKKHNTFLNRCMKVKDFITEKNEDADISEVTSENYGQEAILDIHDVPSEFFSTKNVRKFAEQLCDSIGMKRGPIYSWGENKQLRTNYKNPKINGISVCQFLYSSSITIHALDEIHKVFVNVFSCKQFDAEAAKQFAEENIGGRIVRFRNITRD